jgi:hypothetical protein
MTPSRDAPIAVDDVNLCGQGKICWIFWIYQRLAADG